MKKSYRPYKEGEIWIQTHTHTQRKVYHVKADAEVDDTSTSQRKSATKPGQGKEGSSLQVFRENVTLPTP